MATFEEGETVNARITITDNDPDSGTFGQAVDPDSVDITIVGPGGVKVEDAQAMQNQAVGIYTFEHDSEGDQIGAYVVKYRAVRGTAKSIEVDTYRLVDPEA